MLIPKVEAPVFTKKLNPGNKDIGNFAKWHVDIYCLLGNRFSFPMEEWNALPILEALWNVLIPYAHPEIQKKVPRELLRGNMVIMVVEKINAQNPVHWTIKQAFPTNYFFNPEIFWNPGSHPFLNSDLTLKISAPINYVHAISDSIPGTGKGKTICNHTRCFPAAVFGKCFASINWQQQIQKCRTNILNNRNDIFPTNWNVRTVPWLSGWTMSLFLISFFSISKSSGPKEHIKHLLFQRPNRTQRKPFISLFICFSLMIEAKRIWEISVFHSMKK